jgi:voltage-gated potassium channel
MPRVNLRPIINNLYLLALIGVSVITFGAIAYSVAENVSTLDAIYWAFVTATTLGYGDFSPHTGVGKAASVTLVAFTVVFFIPVITASLSSRLIVDNDAFTHDEQEEIKRLLREVHVITTAKETK